MFRRLIPTILAIATISSPAFAQRYNNDIVKRFAPPPESHQISWREYRRREGVFNEWRASAYGGSHYAIQWDKSWHGYRVRYVDPTGKYYPLDTDQPNKRFATVFDAREFVDDFRNHHFDHRKRK